MTKWLLIAVVVAVAFWWISRQRASRRGRDDRTQTAHRSPPDNTSAPNGASSPKAPQAMVACAQCGMWVPDAESVKDEALGLPYCSTEHRQLGPKP